MADPYRQPREPAKPPKDSMRVVLFAAGALALAIAVVAIAVAASDRSRARTPVVALAVTPSSSVVTEAGPIREAGPEPVRVPLPDGPMSFTASAGACLADCVAHTTIIDAKGKITLSMRVPPSEHGICLPAHPKTLSSSGLAALATHARALHPERLQSSYVRAGEMQSFSTRVEAGGVSYEITHLHGSGAADASAVEHEQAAVDALHREIERLAGTEAWLKTCKRVPRDRLDPHYPSYR